MTDTNDLHSVEASRIMYDGHAQDYEAMITPEELAKPLYAVSIAALSTTRGVISLPFLDVGCGPGHVLELAHRHDPERNLVGVDLSEAMRQLAAKRVPTANFVGGECADLQAAQDAIGGNQFGALSCLFVVHHVRSDRLLAVGAEWARVMAEGSALLVAFWSGNDDPIPYPAEHKISATAHSMKSMCDMLEVAGFEVNEHSEAEDPDMGMMFGVIEATRKMSL